MYYFRWLVFVALCSAATVQAQTTDKPAHLPFYTYVEQMPIFPGGQAGLLETLGQTIYYPTAALEQGIEGQVFVQFIVGTSGSVEDVKVSKGTHPLLDAEAVRAVEKLPAFTPGRQVGKPVPVSFTLPIKFRLPPNVKEILAARAAGTDTKTELARFSGGPEALRAYLSNLPLPTGYNALPNSVRPPRVFVSFEVDSTGAISKIEAV
ncbi:energy transducer TonB [Hymenobacter guriensis]|uniref:Energy transducer TonB n=1 Tax=Hymenobacter guriensis TaxID=2793065 RepID=A0ABS0KYN3_9BACT|nr:energy transducer TonB [Hymenobacter guriensis]MBG8552982.1 energy transducer TonB [Hymenobacter guriensis]